MSFILDVLGRLHPLLVHLPIGIFLLTLVLLWLGEKEWMEVSRSVIRLGLGVSAITATLSCLTGYALSSSGDYDASAVDLHLWMAVFLTLTIWAAWYLYYEYWLRDQVLQLVTGVGFFSLLATGHLGASLTHGEEFLFEPFARVENTESLDITKVNADKALFYSDLVAPILDTKCVGCHGSTKQKGKLRLDSPEAIRKGGKSGKVVLAGKPDDSDLIYRASLPREDEDHMPPKEKPALTDQELAILRLWIEKGADFEKPLATLTTVEERNNFFRGATSETSGELDLPTVQLAPPNQSIINALIEMGVAITPIAKESNFLSVNFVSVPSEAQKLLKELQPLSAHVAWLKLTGCTITDEALVSLKEFTNLTRLSLDDTSLTDAAANSLTPLTSLVFLNLKGTKFSKPGVTKLTSLPKLKELYLYQTQVMEDDQKDLQKLFPHTLLDFGGYTVPTLESDTTIVKQAKP